MVPDQPDEVSLRVGFRTGWFDMLYGEHVGLARILFYRGKCMNLKLPSTMLSLSVAMRVAIIDNTTLAHRIRLAKFAHWPNITSG